MGLSKNQLKLIMSLVQKKYRTKNNLFIAEGIKVVREFLNSKFRLEHLFCIDNSNYYNIENVTLVTAAELKKISGLSTPNNVLALFEIPQNNILKEEGLILALDEINDPGNLGNIIRLCDWFGVDQLVCSMNSVDCYNAKVVQSSMGSMTRVSIVYTDLKYYLQHHQLPKFAAMMNAKIVYEMKLPKNAILLLGNEANGISNDILQLSNESISIPRLENYSKQKV